MDSAFDLAHFWDADKLAALFAGLPVGVVVHGLDGRIVSANRSALDIIGLSLDEITGKTSTDPDWQTIREDGSPYPGAEHPVAICLAGGAPVRNAVMGVKRRTNGDLRWLRIHANPLRVDGAGRGLCLFQDITQRKQLEEQLDMALLGANLGTYDADLQTGGVNVNARYLDILGYAPGELEMSVAEWMARIHPDDFPQIKANYDHVLASPVGYVNNEYRLRHKDGTWVWLLDSGRVLGVDERGEAVRIAGTQMDITARKQAELALQESEARYRTVVESAPVAMLIYVDQRVAMANPACVKLFRAGSEQELLGRDIWSLSSPECHPLVRQRIERAMLRGEENPVAELEIQCLDGTRLPVEGVSVPIEYRGGRAMHIIMADATPRKQADALLRQQREAAEQALALQVAYQTVAGIAHELNQPLNALTTLGEAAERQATQSPELPPRLQETIAGMVGAARRAGSVLGELIGVLRQPAALGGIARLDNLVDEVMAQTRAALPFAGSVDVHSAAGIRVGRGRQDAARKGAAQSRAQCHRGVSSRNRSWPRLQCDPWSHRHRSAMHRLGGGSYLRDRQRPGRRSRATH
jgi:PAS domain S-box-containing protein